MKNGQKNRFWKSLGWILLLLAQQALAQDWAVWRGPQGNGCLPQAPWPAKAIEEASNLLWRADIGYGHGPVAITGNRALAMGTRIETSQGDTAWLDVVYALNAATGQTLWTFDIPTHFRHWPGPASMPITDGERVYAINRDAQCVCLDILSGKMIWQLSLVEAKLTHNNNWGYCASPLLDGERLIFNAGASGAALDKRTGKVLWKSAPATCLLSTPLICEASGQRQVLINSEKGLFRVDPATGRIIGQPYRWTAHADPILLEDGILLTGDRNRNPQGMVRLRHGNVLKPIWQITRQAIHNFQSFVRAGGYIYGLGTERNQSPLQCIDIETGQVQWSKNLGDFGNLILAGNRLIILDTDGDLLIVEATPEAYRELARTRIFDLPDWRRQPDQRPNCCWTMPTLAHNRLYLRTTGGNLACIRLQ